MKLNIFDISSEQNPVSFQSTYYITYDQDNGAVIINKAYDVNNNIDQTLTPVISIKNNSYKVSLVGGSVIANETLSEGSIDRQFWVVSSDINGLLKGPYPYYMKSWATKSHPRSAFLFHGQTEVMSIVKPLRSSVFSECVLTIIASDVILAGDPLEVITSPGFLNPELLRESYFPKIVLSQGSALTLDSPALVTASVVDIDGNPYGGEIEIHFENINGQISHTRKMTVNKTASIQVAAPMMAIGETVRVKAGTKYYSSIEDIALTVTEG